MKQIEIAQLGRGAPEPIRYPVLIDGNEDVVLANELELYFSQGALISPVYGCPDTFTVLRKPSLIGGRRNLRIRIVEVGIADDDTQKILPLFEDELGTEDYSQ